MKLKTDSRSINDFFLHHIEKLVLAVVLVVVVAGRVSLGGSWARGLAVAVVVW